MTGGRLYTGAVSDAGAEPKRRMVVMAPTREAARDIANGRARADGMAKPIVKIVA